MKNISLKEVATVIGEDNVQKLLDAFPGGQTYFRRDFTDIQTRNKIIVEDYYSSSLSRQEMAIKYRLSKSSIDKIIKMSITKKHNI